MPHLILASASPRRAELLGRFGLPFEVAPADVDETPEPGEAPGALVRRLAAAKAAAACEAATGADVVVLAADTVVVLDRAILGKPAGAEDAADMLRMLSGRTHQVLTGIAVATRTAAPGTPPRSGDDVGLAPAVSVALDMEATEVVMDELSDADIAWYVATGEPLDKAGAYGIQGRGGIFVRTIRGSWDNVVGLPLALTRRHLAEAGLRLGQPPSGQPPLV